MKLWPKTVSEHDPVPGALQHYSDDCGLYRGFGYRVGPSDHDSAGPPRLGLGKQLKQF